MFIGMEQMKLSNLVLADEALKASYSMCDHDPLLLNELAVLAYKQGE
jgi:anaphase-promoting complex subunit 6